VLYYHALEDALFFGSSSSVSWWLSGVRFSLRVVAPLEKEEDGPGFVLDGDLLPTSDLLPSVFADWPLVVSTGEDDVGVSALTRWMGKHEEERLVRTNGPTNTFGK
jgi:hypothetical protein